MTEVYLLPTLHVLKGLLEALLIKVTPEPQCVVASFRHCFCNDQGNVERTYGDSLILKMSPLTCTLISLAKACLAVPVFTGCGEEFTHTRTHIHTEPHFPSLLNGNKTTSLRWVL